MNRTPETGWILPEREHVPSPNFTRGRGGVEPDVLMIHYAVDGDQRPDDDEHEESVEFHPRERSHDCMDVMRGLAKPGRKASAHFGIGRDGSKAQGVSLLDTAWDCGDGMLHPNGVGLLVPRVPRALTRRCVSIELSNLGYAIAKAKLEPHEIFTGRHRNPASKSTQWEVYPDVQIDALRTHSALLRMAKPSLRFVLGHEDVTHRHTLGKPGAKLDPGPAFPWHAIDWESLGYRRIVFDFTMRAWVFAGDETTQPIDVRRA